MENLPETAKKTCDFKSMRGAVDLLLINQVLIVLQRFASTYCLVPRQCSACGNTPDAAAAATAFTARECALPISEELLLLLAFWTIASECLDDCEGLGEDR